VSANLKIGHKNTREINVNENTHKEDKNNTNMTETI